MQVSFHYFLSYEKNNGLKDKQTRLFTKTGFIYHLNRKTKIGKKQSDAEALLSLNQPKYNNDVDIQVNTIYCCKNSFEPISSNTWLNSPKALNC